MKRYNKAKYKDFFNYFNRTLKPKSNNNKIKYIPECNYYNIINALEIDIKYFYITNNVSEHINKLLNIKLNSKYRTFNNWKNSLIEIEKEFYSKTEFVKRSNYF